MLAQFQLRYPTGSLISELLTIYQGKYVVRVLIQIEGVTRASGMAAAETVELAEDQARNRALAVVALDGQTPPVKQEQVQASNSAFYSEIIPQMTQKDAVTPTSGLNMPPAELTLEPEVKADWQPKRDRTIAFPDIPRDNSELLSTHHHENNVTPLVPRTPSPAKSLEVKKMVVTEPIDLSDAIARTTVELKRLGWNNQQGREYLEQTYGKKSRQQLTDEQMLEFLHYLESQPTP